MNSGEAETLSQTFDKLYQRYAEIRGNEDPTNSTSKQKTVLDLIKSLEELTREVSAVDLFSRNEFYEEMDGQVLKFLLIPHMLAVLWQMRAVEERKQLCEISQTYFNDFVKRCKDCRIIEEEDEDLEKPEEEDPGPSNQKKKALSPADKRNRKVSRLKENRLLDSAVEAYQDRIAKTEDPDPFVTKRLYTSLIKRALNESEDQLESIKSEMELIKYAEDHLEELESEGVKRPCSKPLKPYIITKNAAQKKVFGMGYPSLPVMTVEEFYEQRRANSEWGPPPVPGSFEPPPGNPEEAEAEATETLEEVDDETTLARRREFDEYKDEHRAGWGNRFNRS